MDVLAISGIAGATVSTTATGTLAVAARALVVAACGTASAAMRVCGEVPPAGVAHEVVKQALPAQNTFRGSANPC